MFSTTEITSHEEVSDNVIHQRLYFAYVKAAQMLSGKVLEIGCGAGRGLEAILANCQDYTAIDKNEKLIAHLSRKYPQHHFQTQHIPPFSGIANNTFDTVITFQVIEHIEQDELFCQEIARVLKPGGKAIITTPNRDLSLTRNPWHVREYNAPQLRQLLEAHFNYVDLRGVSGNEKIWNYYKENQKSVERIARLDVLNLQHRLPRKLLQIPYDLLNRLNRRSLMKQSKGLVSDITVEDYAFANKAEEGLDFFAIARK